MTPFLSENVVGKTQRKTLGKFEQGKQILDFHVFGSDSSFKLFIWSPEAKKNKKRKNEEQLI